MRWWTAWGLPLRLARRDALRARGRSILVLVMIALPVAAVTAADVAIHTQNLTGSEGLDRRLGTAEAKVVVQKGISRIVQGFDPDGLSFSTGSSRKKPLDASQVLAALPGSRLLEERTGGVKVLTDLGAADVETTEVDLQDPLTTGLFELTSGRLPGGTRDVVVNEALLDKGYTVGDTLDLADTRHADPTIVGVVVSTTTVNYPVAAGQLGSLSESQDRGTHTWLVDGPAVSWSTVRQLNTQGASVLSRAVILDPPPSSALPAQLGSSEGGSDSALAAAVLVVVMALIEVVLLAGPAFAVGARKQSHNLALMAAAGGTPRQSRRVVLAGAVVLGATASALGVLIGIGAGRASLPMLQRYSSAWFGPFDVPWRQLAGVAAFGLVSALLAAVVPAFIASRQDVVAVLGGRRGDRRPSLRSPVLGAVLLGVGVAGAAYGAQAQGGGETFIAGSAIFAVLGMVLLVPVALVVASKLSARLPLTLRYAVRDAARHRSRTVPAVAAVAATVAGVVALGIATSSDEAQNKGQYSPSAAAGTGRVVSYEGATDWPAYRSAVQREIPGARVTEIKGLHQDYSRASYLNVSVDVPGRRPLLRDIGSSLGSDLLVSDTGLPAVLGGVSAASRLAAEHELSQGGVVAFTDSAMSADRVRITVEKSNNVGKTDRLGRATLSAIVVPVETHYLAPQAVISTAAARALGIRPQTVGLAVSGTDISAQQESDTAEVLAGLSASVEFSVERGYEAADETVIIQLVLAGLGTLLMLGGTLTATFLALSDARPDLATLSAVGATPRMRRSIAAAYALMVAFVGAALGALVGFIPGIAVTYPLTGDSYATFGSAQPSHYLDIPWLLIVGLVVALPLVTALIVGLTARSRLPLVARLE